MDEKRYKSIVALWGIIFLCIPAIKMVNMAGINPNAYSFVAKWATSLTSLIIILLTVIFMVLSLKYKKAGPIIGMIIGGVCIVASFDPAYMIVGIVFIFSCGDLWNELNKGQAEGKIKKAEKVAEAKVEAKTENNENEK